MAEIISCIKSCKNSNFSGVILPKSGVEELFYPRGEETGGELLFVFGTLGAI